jgi:hypothetical protein
MFRNIKLTAESRLDYKKYDYKIYEHLTGLSKNEIIQIVNIFDEKGGVLNRLQFRDVFEYLNRKWLGVYENSSAISDLVFRAFDKGTFKNAF